MNRFWPSNPLNRSYRCQDLDYSNKQEVDQPAGACLSPDKYYCLSGKVNSADKLHLVIESVKPDHKHGFVSIAPVHAAGAGGLPTPET